MPAEKQFNVDKALENAVDAFWRRGYESTSMQDLVDCMEVNRGSLYATFGGKHELYKSALRNYAEKVCHQMHAELDSSVPPLDAIKTVFDGFSLPDGDGRPTKGCFLTNSALELAAHDTEIREIVAASQLQIEKFFIEKIIQGQKDGCISKDLQPTDTARGLLATLQGLVVLTCSRPEKSLITSVIADAIRRLQ